MPKLYICLVHHGHIRAGVIIHFNDLPTHVGPTEVMDPVLQAKKLSDYLQEDITRSITLLTNLKTKTYTAKENSFLTRIASFWENLLPASEEKDGVLVVQDDSFDFVRTSPDYAKHMWEEINTL